jgi:hypothetical protein
MSQNSHMILETSLELSGAQPQYLGKNAWNTIDVQVGCIKIKKLG